LPGATEDMVVDRLPAGAWLTDLGTHQLRDLPRPERVLQLCHPEVRNDFPPLRTPSTVVSHNLPVQLHLAPVTHPAVVPVTVARAPGLPDQPDVQV
jgi:hypothetical protein